MTEADQSCPLAQVQDLDEQLAERAKVVEPELIDGRKRRVRLADDHPEGDVFVRRAGDPPRRHDPDRVAVEQQYHHQARWVRSLTPPVLGLHGPLDVSDVERLAHVEHEIGKVPLWQPLCRRWRQQVGLHRRPLTVRLRHAVIRSDPTLPCRSISSPRSRHRAGALASGSPVGEGARRAGTPSGVARSAHEAGLTGRDSTQTAAAAAREEPSEQ